MAVFNLKYSGVKKNTLFHIVKPNGRFSYTINENDSLNGRPVENWFNSTGSATKKKNNKIIM